MAIAKEHINGSIVKAFTLLDCFTPDKSEWSLKELSTKAGIHKSTAYRMLATLEQIGAIQQNQENEKYSLGLTLFDLGYRVPLREAVVKCTHPALEKIAKEINETVHLAILKNHQVFYIDKLESPLGLKLSSQIGSTADLHCTSLGKILLAFSNGERAQLVRNIQLDKKTTHTIVRKKELLSALDQIFTQGFAIDREETEIGLICVGVPVFNQQGRSIAALSASGPANRFKEESLSDYVKILQKGATEIQNNIGNFQP